MSNKRGAVQNGDEAGYFVLIDTYVDDKERLVIQWKAEDDSEMIGQDSNSAEYGEDLVQWDSYKEKHPRWGKYYKN